ncbi:MAG: endonuclease domain-containing protein [Rhodothermales bacterium]
MPRRIIPYAPWLVPIARRLRNNSTLSEILLWQHLKGKQIFGYDFHRQRPVDRYIIDFFCVELMLAIEIDGSSHEIEGQWTKDSKRQMRLEKFGIHFLRFDDLAVKKDAEEVARVIAQWVEEHHLN